MRFLRHWKMMIGLAALYGAGCVTGIVLLLWVAMHNPTPETLNRWVNFRFKEYEKRLKLTPEQKEKLKPIAQDTRDQIRAIVRVGLEKTIPVLEDAHRKVDAELTPQQKVEFEKISREMVKHLRDFAEKQEGKTAPPAAAAPPASPPKT
jgi:hypothetical protein